MNVKHGVLCTIAILRASISRAALGLWFDQTDNRRLIIIDYNFTVLFYVFFASRLGIIYYYSTCIIEQIVLCYFYTIIAILCYKVFLVEQYTYYM